MKVLIVDDNMLIRKMVRAVLEEEGMECSEAATAAAAVEAFRVQPPDVCFLDRVLPDGDGLAIIATLKGLPGAERARVFLLTGSVEEGLAGKAQSLGGSGILFKPVDPSQLLRIIRGEP